MSGFSGPPVLYLAGATAEVNASNPSAGAGASAVVMMGLGSQCQLKPKFSTRAFVSFSFSGSAPSADSGAARLFYGTGTPPANGAAQTGTGVGNIVEFTNAGTNVFPGELSAIITGLTPGTTYWFDLRLQNEGASGTVSIDDVSFSAFEI